MHCQLKQNGRWRTRLALITLIAEAQVYDIGSDSEYSDIDDLSSDPDDSWRYPRIQAMAGRYFHLGVAGRFRRGQVCHQAARLLVHQTSQQRFAFAPTPRAPA
jgi:hypothetical protein